MPSNLIKFGDVVVESRGGTSIKTSEYAAIGTPVLTKGDVKPFGRVEHGGKFVNTQFAKEQGWKFSRPSDLIVTTRDLTLAANFLGLVSRIPDDRSFVVNQGATIFRIDETRIDPRYLVYWCCGPEYRQHIQDNYVGSTQIHIRQEDLFSAPLKLPKLPEQLAIVEMLGAFDDKIELNRRMNATLEAVARSLFQSWFVDFDPVRSKLDGRSPAALDAATAALFPEHLEDSPLGHIPKGWAARRLPDAIEVNPRRTLKSGTIAPYLDMKNLPTQGHSAEEVIDREFSSGVKFQKGDTLLARITPCLENGKTGYVDFLEDGQIGWGSTEYIVLAPKSPLPSQFGYFLARSDALRTHAIQNMTGTSGRQRVPSECLNTFWLAIPPPDVARRFDELTAPLMAKIKANASESGTLATLRDTLLPKLLSGELSAEYLKN